MMNLLIIGAGGHGKVVADIARMTNKWGNIAFLDDKVGKMDGAFFPIIGKFKDYVSLKKEFPYAFVAIGENKLRLKWFDCLVKEGFIIPTIIHPFSFISKSSEIGMGTVIMGGAVINAGTHIGNSCIINTSSSVDHDCILEDGVHISPGVNIGGTVRIGKYSWLCIKSSVTNNVSIGKNVVVGAGATVLDSICDNVLVVGTPAKIKKGLE